jgi:hypothetical protein
MKPIYYDNKRRRWYCGKQAIHDGDTVRVKLAHGDGGVVVGTLEESEHMADRWWLRVIAPTVDAGTVRVSVVPADGMLTEVVGEEP